MRRILGAIACAVTLPPILIFVDAALFPRPQPMAAKFWIYWSIAGCLAGLFCGIGLAIKGSRWWALLVIPALVDGYLAVVLTLGGYLGYMH